MRGDLGGLHDGHGQAPLTGGRGYLRADETGADKTSRSADHHPAWLRARGPYGRKGSPFLLLPLPMDRCQAEVPVTAVPDLVSLYVRTAPLQKWKVRVTAEPSVTSPKNAVGKVIVPAV